MKGISDKPPHSRFKKTVYVKRAIAPATSRGFRWTAIERREKGQTSINSSGWASLSACENHVDFLTREKECGCSLAFSLFFLSEAALPDLRSCSVPLFQRLHVLSSSVLLSADLPSALIRDQPLASRSRWDRLWRKIPLHKTCTLKHICQLSLIPLIFFSSPPSEALNLLSSVFTTRKTQGGDGGGADARFSRQRHEKRCPCVK